MLLMERQNRSLTGGEKQNMLGEKQKARNKIRGATVLKA